MKNNLVRKIVGAKRADKRTMDEHELRVEVGVKESFQKKLVTSTWTAWSCRKNGRRKTGKESRCSKSGGESQVRMH